MAQSSRLRLLLVALLSQVAVSLRVVGDEPSWNYDKNGEDWDMPNCVNAAFNQAPIAETMTVTSPAQPPSDWSLFAGISFLTGFQEANITAENHGFSNYTYRINATDANMGFFYGTEAFPANAPQILWNVTQVRFKYPSENTIEGHQYDLEMQIVMNDTLKRALFCTEHMGVLSLFFDVGDTQDDDFWNFVGQDSFKFDLTKVFDKTTAIQSEIFGFMATDSQPDCTNGYCWYLNVPGTGATVSRTITQATLDQLKYKKADGTTLLGNNRAVHPIAAGKPVFNYKSTGLFYNPPTNESQHQVPKDASKAQIETASPPNNEL